MADDRRLPRPAYWPIWRPRPAPQSTAPFLAALIAHTQGIAAEPTNAVAADAYRRAWRLTHPDPFFGFFLPFSASA